LTLLFAYFKELYFCIHEKPLFWGHSKEWRPHTQAFSVFCPFIRLFINFTFQPIGAKDGSRTRNLQLGRLELYQLSYFRLFSYSKFTIDKCKYSSGDRRIRTSEVETTDLQSVPFGHSGISPFCKRAEEGTRTPDLLITNQWLYQLSYFGLIFQILKNVPFYWGCKFSNNFCCCKKKYNFFWFFSKINISTSFLNLKEKGKTLLFLK
jgi:hypothetical protein